MRYAHEESLHRTFAKSCHRATGSDIINCVPLNCNADPDDQHESQCLTPGAGSFQQRSLVENILIAKFGDERPAAAILVRAQDFPGGTEGTVLIRADRPRNTSRHEAAHAVIALATGGMIQAAAVRDGTSQEGLPVDGYVRTMLPLADIETQLWIAMQFTLAGIVLDYKEGRRDKGGAADAAVAEEYAYRLTSVGIRPSGYSGDMTAKALIEKAVIAVADLLTVHANATDRIANALFNAIADDQILHDCDLRSLFETPMPLRSKSP